MPRTRTRLRFSRTRPPPPCGQTEVLQPAPGERTQQEERHRAAPGKQSDNTVVSLMYNLQLNSRKLMPEFVPRTSLLNRVYFEECTTERGQSWGRRSQLYSNI